MVWLAVGVVIVVALAIAIWAQQRHNDTLVELLLPLCGERLEMAIQPGGGNLVAIGHYVGVIASIDPSTRWVTFDWIDFSDDQQPAVGTVLSPYRLASTGIIADCIRWVKPADGPRINLT